MQTNEHDRSPYPQPVAGQLQHMRLNGTCETVDYLPGTAMRIWYTHLDTPFPEHWHYEIEIVFGINGFYASHIDDTRYKVHKDDILIIPPGTRHTLEPSPDCNGFVYLMNVDFLDRIRSISRVMPLLSRPIHLSMTSHPNLCLEISGILREMRDHYFEDNDLRELLVDANMMLLVEKLIHGLFDVKTQFEPSRYDKSGAYNATFNEILLYVNEHYTEDLTIDGIAKKFGFSKYYFTRLFKQYSSYTFCDYLTYRRIKAAEQLITQRDMTITDVARCAGFPNLSTFSRLFHQAKNCTPSEYRKSLQR